MAGFEGTKWAPGQLAYSLKEKISEMREQKAGTYAVSRSLHYGLCQAFEGIRFYARKEAGRLIATFVNLDHNLDRFRRGIAFNLSDEQQGLVPTRDRIRDLLFEFLRNPNHGTFISDMAASGAQGYLRPFTVDDEHSIGVTFPSNPVIRVVGMNYTSYLGEPFSGVTVPFFVRATRANGTGCLKLGGNYLISVKAIQAARRIMPEAASALFLDDRTDDPLRDRHLTEWDSSCALIGLTNGTVIKIPEGPLILPSVTIAGITRILKDEDIEVRERQITYGELVDHVKANEVVTVCSVGTAGILNRVHELLLVDNDRKPLAKLTSQLEHPLARALAAARTRYWDIYRGAAQAAPGMMVESFDLGPTR